VVDATYLVSMAFRFMDIILHQLGIYSDHAFNATYRCFVHVEVLQQFSVTTTVLLIDTRK